LNSLSSGTVAGVAEPGKLSIEKPMPSGISVVSPVRGFSYEYVGEGGDARLCAAILAGHEIFRAGFDPQLLTRFELILKTKTRGI
jgi:hypothetical protein